jgi:predicted component of type VI protein secretion system
MSGLYSDTHPKMEALQFQLWRQASPTRKMHMLAQLNASARVLALAGLRSQHPQDSEQYCVAGWQIYCWEKN